MPDNLTLLIIGVFAVGFAVFYLGFLFGRIQGRCDVVGESEDGRMYPVRPITRARRSKHIRNIQGD